MTTPQTEAQPQADAQNQAPQSVGQQTETKAPVAEPQGGKSGPAKPWMAQLKGHLQSNERLSQFDDFSSVAESFLEFDGKRERLLEIPGANADEKARNEFLKRLGVPDKPDDYQIEIPKLPDGLTWSKEAEADFRQRARSWGLTNGQFKEILAFDTNRQIALLNAQKKSYETQLAQKAAADKAVLDSLKTEWGSDFDANRTAAKDHMAALFSPEFISFLGEKGILDDARVAKEFFAIGKKIGNTKFISGGAPSQPAKKRGFLDLSGVELPPGLK